jgi:cation:H+ antiporter
MAGGEMFVRGATAAAHALGVSELVIGLTVVAFGTSVPELAASVVAALRGHSDLAIGNVIGSNIFNLLLILGAAGTIHPIEADVPAMALDFGFLIGLTAFAILALSFQRKVSRTEGALLALSYVGYITILVLRAT